MDALRLRLPAVSMRHFLLGFAVALVACGGTQPTTPPPTTDGGSHTDTCSGQADGTACDDGNACTQVDRCMKGVCQGSMPVTCAGADQCHDAATCDPTSGQCVTHAKTDGTTCDDGNACTRNDTCLQGACTGGTPVTCMPEDQCHAAGTCDPGTGMCSNPEKQNGTSCDDGNACTRNDTCQAGVCTSGAPVECAAPDQCHEAGMCDPTTGMCSLVPKENGTACDDGNACTQLDTCQAGACVGSSPVVCAPTDQCHDPGTCDPGTGQCSNPVKRDGASCSDGNGCTQTDICVQGVCSGRNPVTCTAMDQCHDAGTCDPGTGMCSNPAKSNGTTCTDGNACTQGDTCQAGLCTGGAPVTCTATDQCHDAGTCNPTTGQCTNPAKPNGTSCDDGSLCTQKDLCEQGSCVGFNPIICTAADQCHDPGTCDPHSGVCSNPAKIDGAVCSDGNACTTRDRCQAGACVGNNPVVCAPVDACHLAGVCQTNTGTCTQPPAAGLTCVASTTEVVTGSPAPADGKTAVSIGFTAVDGAGQILPNLPVAITVTGQSVTVNAPATTDSSGSFTATFTSTVAETKTVHIVLDTGANARALPDESITFLPGAADHLIFTQAPTTVRAGATFSATAEIVDALNNPVASSAAVTLQLDSGTLIGMTSAGAVNETVTFTGIVAQTAKQYQLIAASSGLKSAQAPFTVTPADPANISFPFPPTTSQPAGAVLTSTKESFIRVAVVDLYGNTVSTPETVTLALANAGTTHLGGTVTKSSTDGNVLFPNLTVLTAGTGYALTASASGLSDATSSTFDIVAATPTQFAFSTQPPPGGIAGVAFSTTVAVDVDDAYGNRTAASTPVTLSALTSGGATITQFQATTAAGRATFPSLQINQAGNGEVLRASGAYASATSTPFNITPSSASALVFSPIGTSTAGVAITTTVLVEDGYGNVVPTTSGNVQMTFALNPANATLKGTLTKALVNGVATFNDLTIDRPSLSTQLQASLASLPSGQSAAFAVLPNWVEANVGLPVGPVNAVAVAPSSPYTLYAATNSGGLYKSTNRGDSWALANTGLPTDNLLQLAVNPGDANTVYVTTAASGVYKTTNGGNAWAAANNGLGSLNTGAIVIGTTAQNTLYVSAGTASSGNVYTTTDGGQSWTATVLGSIASGLAVSPMDANTVLATAGSVLFRTTSAGTLWSSPLGVSLAMSAPAFDPTNVNALWCADLANVYTTINAGSTWTKPGAVTSGTVSVIVVDPQVSGAAWIGLVNGGVKLSAGGYGDVSSGVSSPGVFGLAVDPTDSRHVYLATQTHGVYRTVVAP